jgi:hypothetical protein
MLYDTETELSSILSSRTGTEKFTELLHGSAEYMMVNQRFMSSSNFTVFRIERNNNPKLLKEFKQATKGKGKEQLLFHGSQNINYMNILTNGFDISRSNCGSLGVGVYFAQDASYSNGFTSPLLLGDKDTQVYNILLCRVVLAPGTGAGAGIWAVRNDRYAYPEYIVYYKL